MILATTVFLAISVIALLVILFLVSSFNPLNGAGPEAGTLGIVLILISGFLFVGSSVTVAVIGIVSMLQ